MKKLISLIFIILALNGQTQTSHNGIEIQKVEPPFWWTGMKNPELQLLIYGKNIQQTTPSIAYPGLVLTESQKVENPNYLFIRLRMLPSCAPGFFDITFSKDGEELFTWNYELKGRKPESAQRAGFGRADVLYLVMPDRFSNGNPANDSEKTMTEAADRANPSGRHGGDIQGIMNHLDYIRETGFTGLWLNPLLENNNPDHSYHGYAITDFYRIDPRYGTNADYLNLVNTSHKKGLKVVMDMIFNHSSVHHWLIKDLPAPDWIHQFDTYTRSNFRASTIMDPYVSDYDKKKMLTGWFDHHMADLDQRNPLLASYLIQNTLWWIEYSGIDGIRVDTQPYPYKAFMSKWGEAVFREYPNFNVVGEAWMQKEALTAYFQKGTPNRDGYNSNIPCITDFPMHGALNHAFNETDTWTEGLPRIYYVLAQDYLYGDPFKNMIFVDNHDVTRFFTAVEEDLNKWKMAMAVLATMRGIPCIYYGTEILMTGNAEDGHGTIREDFPGGWAGDVRNAFTSAGRTAAENKAYEYLKRLLQWRKKQDVIHSGKFKHFVPDDNVYVYFRYNEKSCVMVALNNNSHELKALEHEKFIENMKGYSFGKNVITGEIISYLETITIPPKSAIVLELIK